MKKLTEQQIIAIDKALLDIEIQFLDVRIEMTDHIATSLEFMEGNFEDNLKNYISENKKKLKKNYSQFRTNAGIKSVKLLIKNMFTLRFLAINAVLYFLLLFASKYIGIEETSTLFTVFSVLAFLGLEVYIAYAYFTRSTKIFSTAGRLIRSTLGIAFLLIFPMRMKIEELNFNETIVLLYYAFTVSFFIIIGYTYTFLNNFYTSRYKINEL